MTEQARRELEQAWLRVLGDRHPDIRWRLVRPSERRKRDSMPTTRQIVRGLAAPEDESALVDPNVRASAADKNGIDGGGE